MKKTITNNLQVILLLVMLLILVGLWMEKKHFDAPKVTQIPVTDKFRVKTTNSIKRLEWLKQKRGGGYDIQKMEAAKKYLRKQFSNQKDGQISNWESLGPDDLGGRVRAITYHPTVHSTIFLGAAAGGIWRSTNSGNNWSLMTSPIDALPVMDIIYHPTNANIMLAATGEYNGGGPEYPGAGILKSTDGGISWVPVSPPPGSNFSNVSKIRFHPSDASTVYASGSERDQYRDDNIATLYISDDGGDSWEIHWQDPASTPSGNIYDLEINQSDPDYIYIGVSRGAKYSSDGGDSFNDISFQDDVSLTGDGYSQFRTEIQFCTSQPDSFYLLRHLFRSSSDDNHFYRTELWKNTSASAAVFLLNTAGRSNSNSNNILGRQGQYDNVLWVNPLDCDQVLMGGVDMWRYRQGDVEPERISDWFHDIGGNRASGENNSIHADQHVITHHPNFNNTTNQAILIGNDGGIYKTDEVNNVAVDTLWESLVNDLDISQFYGGDISLTGDTIIGGTQDNGYTFSTAGNSLMKGWDVYSTGDGGFCTIDKSNPDIMFSTTQFGKIYKSFDGGATFCHIFSMENRPLPSSCCDCPGVPYTDANDFPIFIAPFIMNPSNSQHLLIGGDNLIQSTDSGESWDPITFFIPDIANNAISAIDISMQDPNVIWYGRENSILSKTIVGGGNNLGDWVSFSVTNSNLPNHYVTDIAIHPLDTAKVAVTFGGYHQDHVYITFDGGSNWHARPLGIDMHISTVRWLPNLDDVLYVGTDIGVFASEDNGQSWSVDPFLPNSEGPVYTGVEELFWQGNGTSDHPYRLVAATHGRGMWRQVNAIKNEIFVDKDCSPCGEGSMDKPFQTFVQAYNFANPGNTITFLSGGNYEEISMSLIVQKKLIIRSQASNDVIVK